MWQNIRRLGGALLLYQALVSIPDLPAQTRRLQEMLKWFGISMQMGHLKHILLGLFILGVLVGAMLILWDLIAWCHRWCNRPKRFYEMQGDHLFGGMESRTKKKVDVDYYPYCTKHRIPFVLMAQNRHLVPLRCSLHECNETAILRHEELASEKAAVINIRLEKMK